MGNGVENEGVVNESEDRQQVDADAMAEMMAGYNKVRSNRLHPTEEATPPVAQTVAEEVPADVVTPDPKEEPDDEVPQAPTLEERLAAFKEEVRQLAGDPTAVRKLHGEIGDINRRLKEVEQKPKVESAPVKDELTAALEEAERLESEFPEIAGTLVKEIKVVANQRQDKTDSQAVNSEQIAATIAKQREKDAQDALYDEHPDFQTVRETPEFKAWFAAKPRDYQERVENTWNPIVVSRSLSEFKETLAKKQKKQDRLAAAVTPQSVPAPAKPSTIPDEDGLMIGYNKVKNKMFNR
jgi:hypothetical protein